MYSEVMMVMKVLMILWFDKKFNLPIPYQPSPMQLILLSLLSGNFPSWYELRTHLLVRDL